MTDHLGENAARILTPTIGSTQDRRRLADAPTLKYGAIRASAETDVSICQARAPPTTSTATLGRLTTE